MIGFPPLSIVEKCAIVGSIFISVVVGTYCAGISDETKNNFVDTNVVYDVRDVHIGYEGGYRIIMVEYYDGDVIRTVDNQMGVHYRINHIDTKRSLDGNATLLLYAVNIHSKKSRWSWDNSEFYPRCKYVLSIPDDMDCGGLKTHIYHTDYEDDESWIN